ncbi:MAG: GlsB/YeaQ/YmgE family stress response membrane protein [Mesorhizobium sp.]
MHLSNESIIVIVVVGLIAGWLAGKIVRGAGFGLIADIVIGIIGAFIGDWLLPRLGIHLGSGTISLIVNATVGAIVLLLIIRLVAGRGRFGGGRFGRRW